MSYQRVYSSRINWQNFPAVTTPIDEINLNKMDYALNQIDGTLASWDTSKANTSDMNLLEAKILQSVKTIDYNTTTGVFVFTWWNGTTKTIDLNIEKIPVDFSMSPQGVITMTTADGTQYTCDISTLIKLYTFTDSTTIDFTVSTDVEGNKTIVADIMNGSITAEKLNSSLAQNIGHAEEYATQAAQSATAAAGSATASDKSSEDSEAWAVGQRDGIDVPSSDTTYENNSKYYSEESAQKSSDSEAFANGTRDGQPVPSTDPAYHNNAKYWSTQTAGNSLQGLEDVDIDESTLANQDILKWIAAREKWANVHPSAGAYEAYILGHTLYVKAKPGDVRKEGHSLIVGGSSSGGGGSVEDVELLYGETEITSDNKDLNNYTQIGNYYKESTEFACTHCPYTNTNITFRVRVTKVSKNSDYVRQTIYDTNSNANTLGYYRVQTSANGWSGWKKFAQYEDCYVSRLGDTLVENLAAGQVLAVDDPTATYPWHNKYLSQVNYDSSNTLADIIGDVETLLAAL